MLKMQCHLASNIQVFILAKNLSLKKNTLNIHFRMRVKKLPHILALHLKRFKYMDQLNRYTKLSYRVVFPLELRLFNTVSANLTVLPAYWLIVYTL